MLVAIDNMDPDQELTVASNDPILGSESADGQWLATFDGGARARTDGEGRCAGAAATIWAPVSLPLASTVMPAPPVVI